MRLYPIRSGFFDRENCEDHVFSNYEPREGQAAFYGDFGSIYINHLDGYYTIDRVCFDLKQPTWVYYKFSETRSAIIQGIDYISFKIRDTEYNVSPNKFLHISGYSTPEFLLFPAGKYEFYLIPGVALDVELDICRLDHYDKLTKQIDFFDKKNTRRTKTAKS
ncbi:hypothetical protein [Chitinophaga sp. CF418]|uniref:hypothetical protein n=1 Tax=Chitinophaga sp. CF418 TaxID=1855287 RepID=UPI00091C524B|nr:hypothetical protein [Chitinophaga sp. CF418]SHN34208.1 hypothetical protein SAMN05216311_109257 [Chitinophaga sp. CF418]